MYRPSYLLKRNLHFLKILEKNIGEVVDCWNGKRAHQTIAFLCHSSAGYWKINITFTNHSISVWYLFIEHFMYARCLIYVCSNNGVVILSLRFKKIGIGPFTTWQKKEKKRCASIGQPPRIRWEEGAAPCIHSSSSPTHQSESPSTCPEKKRHNKST